MRRVLRIVFSACTALSLVLCLAAVVMWVRGYFVTDRFFREEFEDEGGRTYWRQDMARCGRGGIGMSRIVQSGESVAPDGRTWREALMARPGRPVPLHKTEPPAYPHFRFGVGDDPVWGGFKRGAFSRPDPGGGRRPATYAWQVVAPFWAIVPPLTVLPLIWGWRRVRLRGRRAAGHCPACGYDLRATPDRCPECGAGFEGVKV